MRKVIRSKGDFTLKDGHQVYELNLETGMVLIAPLTFHRAEVAGQKDYYTISEKSMHLYMPAKTKELATKEFNRILNSVKKK